MYSPICYLGKLVLVITQVDHCHIGFDVCLTTDYCLFEMLRACFQITSLWGVGTNEVLCHSFYKAVGNGFWKT